LITKFSSTIIILPYQKQIGGGWGLRQIIMFLMKGATHVIHCLLQSLVS